MRYIRFVPGIQRRRSLVALIGLLALLLMLGVACQQQAPAAQPPAEVQQPAATEAPMAEPTAAPQAEEAPSEPTTFRIAVGIDPDTLDPALFTTTTVANIVEYMAQTPITTDQEGNVQPQLVTEWEVSDDNLEYTFKLREGVTFHDGEPFNAEAFKWNMDRVLDPDVPVAIRSPFANIDSVEVVDEYTAKLHMKQPFAPLISSLSLETDAMVSPASVDMEGNSYDNLTVPVGTGPYKFKERVSGERIVLERNPDYWGDQPYYDEVVFRVVPEAATRESLLLAGQVDLIILPPISDLPALGENPDVQVLLAPSDRTIFIAMNNNDEVLSDKRVRQALNYAVNKQDIIDSILFGAAEPLDAPAAPSLFGYCPQEPYGYDPERAQELLAEAGAENVQLDFIAPTGRYVQDFQAAQAIAGYLTEVGVQTSPQTMDWPSYIGAITTPPDENQLDLHFLGWAPSYLDAAQQMVQFQSSQHPPNGLASSFYSNPEVDQLIDQAGQETDPEKRQDLYCQAEGIIWDEAPWIFLWVQRFPIVYSAEVTNVTYHPTEKFAAIYARPAE